MPSTESEVCLVCSFFFSELQFSISSTWSHIIVWKSECVNNFLTHGLSCQSWPLLDRQMLCSEKMREFNNHSVFYNVPCTSSTAGKPMPQNSLHQHQISTVLWFKTICYVLICNDRDSLLFFILKQNVDFRMGLLLKKKKTIMI